VQEADWVFKTTFDVDESELEKDCVDLYFEGLDTYCTIVLVRLVGAVKTLRLTL
jgi:beta-mannosidase